jgi:hypothetical protein
MYFPLKFKLLLLRGQEMGILPVYKIFWIFLLLCAATCILQPVMAADNGTITIAYRGSGGSYVGETVVFDGRNTYGNTTLLKITGPGLPAEGVPVNNLNGASGGTTSVEVDQYGAWKYVWYASSVPGVEKLKTGKYTFTATDSHNPDKSSTAFFMLEKPEYKVSSSPNPVNPGNYVEVIGNAEQGITYARIDVADSSGKILHSFTSPVSSSGYFSYGFHVDMSPGQYPVTVSNPALKSSFGTVMSVVPEGGTQPVTIVTTPAQVSASRPAQVTAEMTTEPAPQPTPTKSPVALVTILAGLMAGCIVAGISRRL